MKQQILQILSETNKSSTINARIKKINSNFFKEMPQLSINSYENMYLWLNDLTEIPKCKQCNIKNLKYLGINDGYNLYCSRKCYHQNDESKEKRKNTCMKKYGGNSSLCDPTILNKAKKTMLERYGVEHALQNSILQNKANSTIIERFGPIGLKSKSIRDKSKKTNLEKYGVEYSSQNSTVKEKVKSTQFKKYGMWKTQTPEGRLKLSASKKKSLYDKLNERCPMTTPNFTLDDYMGVGVNYEWQCDTCDTIFKDHMDDGTLPICPKCNNIPTVNQSKGEIEVGEYIQNILNVDIEQSNKSIISPYELDIVIPKKKIAIEYNGLYWHSDRKILNDYHKMKLNMCNDQGYQLITIFEDEWINKKEICKNRLKHILGTNSTTCYARQTMIKETSNIEYKSFLTRRHIQGHIGAKIKLGAYYDDILVAVMSFGQKRRALGNKTQKDNEYELLRFCTNGSIPGIGSKLFKYFTRNYKPINIISYCDLRWGNGGFYEKINFVLSHTSPPNYWYSNDGVTKHHRYQFRKSVLINEGFNPNLTEKEIMESKGFYRIYDCGNKVYNWNNK